MDRRPLIAIRATPLLFPAAGVAHYIRSLASELTAAGDNIVLFTPMKWGVDANAPAAPSATAVRARQTMFRAIPRPRALARGVETALLAINARVHRVALYHEPATFPLPFGGPTVVTVHDLSWIRFPETHPEDRRRTMDRSFPKRLAAARHVITDSEFVKRELLSEFGVDAGGISVAPLAARPCFHPREPDESRGLLDRLGLRPRSFLLAVGTLEPRKNLPRTLRAYARLPASVRQRFPLVLVGASGWKTSELEREMAPMVERGEVRPLGFTSDDDLARLYCSATAVVYASLYEGFGLPPLEAMASGTAVLASNASSVPEVVGDAGLLVDPLDEAAITDGLQRLIDDGALRATLAERGLARARTFSWPSCAATTREVYRTVLANP